MSKVIIEITVNQIKKLLEYLYVACDESKGKMLKDKELMKAIRTFQKVLNEKTGRWW